MVSKKSPSNNLFEDYEKMFPQLFSEYETAQQLRCSQDTLSRERKRKRIGFTLISGRVFYTFEQIQEYLENQTVDPDRG